MLEVVELPLSIEAWARIEAVKIIGMRREITRQNRLRDIDRQLLTCAFRLGLSRAAAYAHADRYMQALHDRIEQIRDRPQNAPSAPIIAFKPREVAA